MTSYSVTMDYKIGRIRDFLYRSLQWSKTLGKNDLIAKSNALLKINFLSLFIHKLLLFYSYRLFQYLAEIVSCIHIQYAIYLVYGILVVILWSITSHSQLVHNPVLKTFPSNSDIWMYSNFVRMVTIKSWNIQTYKHVNI